MKTYQEILALREADRAIQKPISFHKARRRRREDRALFWWVVAMAAINGACIAAGAMLWFQGWIFSG
jgi:hypothetical protein